MRRITKSLQILPILLLPHFAIILLYHQYRRRRLLLRLHRVLSSGVGHSKIVIILIVRTPGRWLCRSAANAAAAPHLNCFAINYNIKSNVIATRRRDPPPTHISRGKHYLCLSLHINNIVVATLLPTIYTYAVCTFSSPPPLHRNCQVPKCLEPTDEQCREDGDGDCESEFKSRKGRNERMNEWMIEWSRIGNTNGGGLNSSSAAAHAKMYQYKYMCEWWKYGGFLFNLLLSLPCTSVHNLPTAIDETRWSTV